MMHSKTLTRANAKILLLTPLLWTSACPQTDPNCYSDAQCPDAQICNSQGLCVPATTDDASIADAFTDAGSDSDHADRDAGSLDTLGADHELSNDATQPLCPAWDQHISRDEMPLGPGLQAHVRVIDPEQPVEVSLVPSQTDNGPLWDFSAQASGEQSAMVETLAIDDMWFAEDFSDADYVTLLIPGGDVYGIFALSDTSLTMLGLASTDADRINLRYDPAVVLFAYPFTVGDQWGTESQVSGIYENIYTSFFESYQFSVTQAGQAKVPGGTFDVLELHLDRENRVPTLNPFYKIITTQIKYLYVAQCYGTVATVTSLEDETEDSFTQALEFTRLGF